MSKNSLNKIFISLSFIVFFVGIIIFSIKKDNSYTFSTAVQEHGTKEINFSFNKSIVSLGSHEENVSSWSNLMKFHFTDNISGQIRPISENSFAFILDTPYSKNTDLNFTISSDLFTNSNLSISVNYKQVTSPNITIPATKFEILNSYRKSENLIDPIILTLSLPTPLETLKKLISISNQGKDFPFYLKYGVKTNYSQYQEKIVQNYSQVLVYPSGLKKNSSYTLNISAMTPSEQVFSYNFKTFPTFQWKGLKDDSFPPLLEEEISRQTSLPTILNSDSFLLEASTPLNTKFARISVQSIPSVSNLNYQIQEQGIIIKGDFKRELNYKLIVNFHYLRDVYKQKISLPYTNNFQIKSTSPQINQIQDLVVLSKNKAYLPIHSINTTNIRIEYKSVNSSYYAALALYGEDIPIPSAITNITLSPLSNEWSWTDIDLSQLMNNQSAMLLIKVYDPINSKIPENFTRVLISKNSFTAHLSSTDILLHVRSLKDQKPVDLMMVSIWDPNRKSFQDLGRTTSEGTLRINNPTLPLEALERPIFIGLSEENGFANISFLTPSSSYFQGTNNSVYSSAQFSFNRVATPSLYATIFTDRQRYKTQEPIYVNIIGRTMDKDVLSSEIRKNYYTLSLLDKNYNNVTNIALSWSEFGATNFIIDPSWDLKEGFYTLQICDRNKNFIAQNNFEIIPLYAKHGEIVLNVPKSKYYYKEQLEFTIGSQFFTGQTQANDVVYSIQSMPYFYINNNFPNFQFGSRPAFSPLARSRGIVENKQIKKGMVKFSSSKTNALIFHRLRALNENSQLIISAFATNNLEEISKDLASVIVLNPVQIGIQTSDESISTNEAKIFNLIALNSYSEQITNIPAYLEIFQYKPQLIKTLHFLTNFFPRIINLSNKQRIYHQQIRLDQTNISYLAQEPGNYEIQVSSIVDRQKTTTTVPWYVYKKKQDPQRLQISLDKGIYKSGDTALLNIKNPFPIARLLLITERNTIREYQTITLSNTNYEHSLTITSEDEPGLTITAVLSATEFDGKEGAIIYGSKYLPVSPNNKEIILNVSSDKTSYVPRDQVKLTITPSLNIGTLDKSEAVIIITDRSVLDSDNTIQNPLDYFYRYRDSSFNTWDNTKILYDMRAISNSPAYDFPMPFKNPMVRQLAYSGKSENSETPQGRISSPYTIFHKVISLQPQQTNEVVFDLPNNIGGFEVSVIAYDKNQLFGKTNIMISSQKDLFVESHLPQFIRPNDQLTWRMTINNLSGQYLNLNYTMSNYFINSTNHTSIGPLSSQSFDQEVVIPKDYSNSIWTVYTEGSQKEDSYQTSVPIFREKQFTISSLSFLVQGRTNIRIQNNQVDSEQKINIYLSSLPLQEIKNEIDSLLSNQSLSFEIIQKQISLLYHFRNQISEYNLSVYTAHELDEIFMNDSQNLSLFTFQNNRLNIQAQGSNFTTNPEQIIQFFETLFFAQIYHSYDKDNIKKISQLVDSYFINRQFDPDIRAYAGFVLARYQLLDRPTFDNIYPTINRTATSKAWILQTMHLLGYPLDIISQQTSDILQYTSSSGNRISMNTENNTLIDTLIQFYGAREEAQQVLNNFSSVTRKNLLIYLRYIYKYKLNSQGSVIIDAFYKQYILNSSNSSQSIDIENAQDINIGLSSIAPEYIYITYKQYRTNTEPINSGYSIKKQFFDEENNPVSPDNLKFGMNYWVELSVNSSLQGTTKVEIIDPLYGGLRIRGNNSSSVPFTIFNDKMYIYRTFSGNDTFRYQVYTLSKGTWTAPPMIVLDINSPDAFSSIPQNSIKIQ